MHRVVAHVKQPRFVALRESVHHFDGFARQPIGEVLTFRSIFESKHVVWTEVARPPTRVPPPAARDIDVKTLVSRKTRFIRSTQMPLADKTGLVTTALQGFSERDLFPCNPKLFEVLV